MSDLSIKHVTAKDIYDMSKDYALDLEAFFKVLNEDIVKILKKAEKGITPKELDEKIRELF